MSKIETIIRTKRFDNIISKSAKFLITVFLLSPIFAMIAYLLVNKYTDDCVINYSLIPSDVFYYIE